MPHRIGRYTVGFETCPVIISSAASVGKMESEGPLGNEFDNVFADIRMGQETWEQAESMIMKKTVETALKKASLTNDAVDMIFAGDLLNQCIGSTFGLLEFGIPLAGLFGACSTMALSLGLASCFVAGGLASTAIATTSSHFCTAERQFRFPVEYGSLRTPTSQWTVTGSGAAVVSGSGSGVEVRAVTFGRPVDLGINDANNMGAAMAPAAADTIKRYFDDTGCKPGDFDIILTGDLGSVGSELLLQLLQKEGLDLSGRHADCGVLIFDSNKQDVHAGGSGCGCSASVLCSRMMHHLREGTIKRMLFCATGALMSTTSNQQGENTPGIAHLVELGQQNN